MDRYRIPKQQAMTLWVLPDKGGSPILKLPRSNGRPVTVPCGTALVEEPAKKCKPDQAERKAWQQVREAYNQQKVAFLGKGKEPDALVLIDLDPLESGTLHVDGMDKAYALYNYGLIALCGKLGSQFDSCKVASLPFEKA